MAKPAETPKRVSIPKSIRFEVFKRDHFTCQYCGQKAPDIVLHVDHIDPVSKGGSSEIINLITSCHACNSGKSDKRLTDTSALDKQRKQLELIQESREQIELMFQWKESLSNLDKETLEMIKDYAHARIQPFTISENGETSIRTLLRKYGIEDLLTAIDISADTYIKYDSEGNPTKQSVENFINKLGGILFNRSLKPIDQKLAQIKHKASNAFNYYDPRKAAILLNQYVKALRTCWGYTDEQIITDLDKELAPKLEDMTNWTAWRDHIEAWTTSIKEKKESEPSQETKERTQEQLEGFVRGRIMMLEEKIIILSHILSPYPSFNREQFEIALRDKIIEFIENQKVLSAEKLKEYDTDEDERKMYIWDFTSDKSLTDLWSYDYSAMLDRVDDSKEDGEKLRLFMGLENVASTILDELFDEQFYFGSDVYSPTNLVAIREMTIGALKNKV